jgi:type IV pilus assembly PilM-like protein
VAAEVSLNGSVRLERSTTIDLPVGAVRDGEVVDVPAVTDALKQLWSDNKGLRRDVRIGVANAKIVVRTLDVPPVAASEVDAVVRQVVADELPMAMESAVLDYEPVGIVETAAGPRQRVVVVAARKEMVEAAIAAAAGAGLKTRGVDLPAFAMIRILGGRRSPQPGEGRAPLGAPARSTACARSTSASPRSPTPAATRAARPTASAIRASRSRSRSRRRTRRRTRSTPPARWPHRPLPLPRAPTRTASTPGRQGRLGLHARRQRPERAMSARDRFMHGTVAVAVAAAVAAAWLLAVAPKRQEGADLGAQVAQAQARLGAATARDAVVEQARASYRKDYATVARLGKAMPPRADVASLVFQLEAAARAARVDFRSVTVESAPATAPPSKDAGAKATGTGGDTGTGTAATAPAAASGVEPQPFTFSFEGTFVGLRRLLAAIDRFSHVDGGTLSVSGPLLTVDSVVITAGRVGLPNVKADITAKAYVADLPAALPGARPRHR